MSIEVTVHDTETGRSDTTTLENNYLLVTEGTCEMTHLQAYANGTHVITIKGRQR